MKRWGCAILLALVASPGRAAASDLPRVETEAVGIVHAFEHAAARVGPSVVSITSQRPITAIEPGLQAPDETSMGLGSGLMLDVQGHILTNHHVVDGAVRIDVELHDGRIVEAHVVGTDPPTDLAVIRIAGFDGLAAKPAELGQSSSVRVGQWVMAAGSPFGLTRSFSAGIVSAIGRGPMGIADFGDFIQTDAAVNFGNSGGPLVDLRGRVIGINTAIASNNGGSNGVGFAIPIDFARGIAAQLITRGQVQRGWIGIVLGELTPELAASFGFRGKGILVDDLSPRGPAHLAGLRAGDIVAAIDDAPVETLDAFRHRIASLEPGTKVALAIWRAGQTKRLTVQLAARPAPAAEWAEMQAPQVREQPATRPLGLHLGALEPEAVRGRGSLRPGGARVARVAPNSAAAEAGLGHGDVIVSVDGRVVRSPRHARRLIAKSKGPHVRLHVRSGGRGRFVLLLKP